jgi:hypothetical protein
VTLSLLAAISRTSGELISFCTDVLLLIMHISSLRVGMKLNDDYTPALPPDLAAFRIAGPLLPSTSGLSTPPPNRRYVGPSLPRSQAPYDDDMDSDGLNHFLPLMLRGQKESRASRRPRQSDPKPSLPQKQ